MSVTFFCGASSWDRNSTSGRLCMKPTAGRMQCYKLWVVNSRISCGRPGPQHATRSLVTEEQGKRESTQLTTSARLSAKNMRFCVACAPDIAPPWRGLRPQGLAPPHIHPTRALARSGAPRGARQGAVRHAAVEGELGATRPPSAVGGVANAVAARARRQRRPPDLLAERCAEARPLEPPRPDTDLNSPTGARWARLVLRPQTAAGNSGVERPTLPSRMLATPVWNDRPS